MYDQYLSFMNMSLGNVSAALDANEFFKSPIFYVKKLELPCKDPVRDTFN